jgi:mannosyltransferase OCH1-like enzyme
MVIIPKIIHQIWLGGEVPEEFKALMQGWIDRYVPRGWEYRLWTDADIESFGLYNKAFYDQTTNYGVKSDILKWEIIHRLGGVYIDVDFEPLQLLDVLHHTYDFYVGIQPLDTQFLQLGAALFAATPGHPILRHCIETIKDDWHHHGAPTKTGPVHFTKSFFKMAGKDGRRDIAFPASYMYPLGCQEKTLDYETWIHNGAYAIHHWAKSWMPKNYRPAKFRTINNDDSSKSWND